MTEDQRRTYISGLLAGMDLSVEQPVSLSRSTGSLAPLSMRADLEGEPMPTRPPSMTQPWSSNVSAQQPRGERFQQPSRVDKPPNHPVKPQQAPRTTQQPPRQVTPQQLFQANPRKLAVYKDANNSVRTLPTNNSSSQQCRDTDRAQGQRTTVTNALRSRTPNIPSRPAARSDGSKVEDHSEADDESPRRRWRRPSLQASSETMKWRPKPVPPQTLEGTVGSSTRSALEMQDPLAPVAYAQARQRSLR